MSSPVTPGVSTFEAQAQQKAQQQKAAQQAADQAYFDAVRAQFRQSQAEAAAKGQVLTSQTVITNPSGQGTVQSTYENAATLKGTSMDPSLLPGRYQPDVVNLNQPLSVAPTGPQTAAQNAAYINRLTSGVPESGKPLPVGYEYANPVYNQYFGNKRIGDIITEQVARGDKGLYAPRTTYDYGDVKQFLTDYAPAAKRYTVNLSDSFSGPQTQEYYFNPLDPYAITTKPPPPQKVQPPPYKIPSDLAEQYGAGYRNVFLNYGSLIGGQRYPELEGDIYGAIASGGTSGPKGGFTLFTSQSMKALGELVPKIVENPLYYFGSAAASAGIFLGTAAAGSAAKDLVVGGRLSKVGSRVATEIGLTPTKYESEYMKWVKVKNFPEEIKLTPVQEHYQRLRSLDVQYSGERARFGKASIDAPKPDLGLQRSQLTAREIGKLTSAEDYKNPLGSEFAPQEPTTKGGGTFKEFKPIYEEKSANLGTGTSGKYETQQEIDSAKKAFRDLQQAQKKAADEVLREQTLNPTEQKIAETASREATPGISKQEPSVAPGVSLGFGGATGAERIRRANLIKNEDYVQFLTVPPQSGFSFALTPSQQLSPVERLNQSVYNNLSYGLNTQADQVYRNLLGISNLPESATRTTPITMPIVSPLMIPLSTPMTMPITATLTIPKMKPLFLNLNVPSPSPITTNVPRPEPTRTTERPSEPRIRLPAIGEYKRRRKRGTFPDLLRSSKTLWRVDPLLRINTKELDKLFGLGTSRSKRRNK